MDNETKESIWKQFGGTIDMLENAMQLCPPNNWNNKNLFWYKAYHCIFYLDYYLDLDPDNFHPPAPFTLSEFSEDLVLPERVYSKEELLNYLQYCRTKCHILIKNITSESAKKRWINPYKNYSLLEILMYNMRHVQHHAAQLNLLLRLEIDNAPNWVSQTKAAL